VDDPSCPVGASQAEGGAVPQGELLRGVRRCAHAVQAGAQREIAVNCHPDVADLGPHAAAFLCGPGPRPVDVAGALARKTYIPYYRYITGTGSCGRAAMKRSPTLVSRAPLLRSTGLTCRRRPIRPESERWAAVRRDSAAARDLVRDRDGCCVLCGGPGVDAHHRLPRGRGGAFWDPSRFALSRLIWLCRGSHRRVESRRTLGLRAWSAVRHGVIPCSEVPVFRHGRWVLLTDDGMVTSADPSAASGGNFAEIRAAS
jgi:hypothetical protein